MNSIARISYLNTSPFFANWSEEDFPLLYGTPRQLARLVKNEDFVAGPLPLVDCWRLEDSFDPLGHWGIAVKNQSRSVFLLSHVPLSELNHVPIGMTDESSTSVALLKTLIECRYGHKAIFRRGFQRSDEARLLIGDEALKIWTGITPSPMPVVTDLASEWWEWKQQPFVFARWVVRKDLDLPLRRKLEEQITASLAVGKKDFSALTKTSSPELGSQKQLVDYLHGFTYELGQPEADAIRSFRRLVDIPLALVK